MAERSLFRAPQDLAALVTGAGSGIGAATAVALAEAGIGRLALMDRDAVGLSLLERRLPPGVETLPLVHDVADPLAWDQSQADIRDRFGRLDLAVVNAGISAAGPIETLAFRDWRRVLSANLDGAFLSLQAAFRLIRRGGRGGAVVLVSSVTGLKAEPGTAAYGASKAGLIQLGKVAAREGAPDRIRVNVLAPGGVKTPIWRDMDFFRDLIAEHGGEEAAFAALAGMATPLGRYAEAEEIAGQIVHLLSDRSATTTGAVQVIDGGYSL
ncbi:SDR family NAD(P)-dependent oxidoreductase [Zavarzinia sp. CC-PAN008]|uniref:SDR family NAD(P)-dependent oxidoreductase n=1 Tax=Zavarzinia sp. CC-PAN008 TaxID=3243332 RepID=UPI003F747CF2